LDAVKERVNGHDTEALLSERGGIMLDIGGGHNPQPGFINMDHQPLDGVDIVHNWNDFPWPLPDESVVTAVASHVVEHVSPIDGNFIRWMDEVWRVLKPDGQLAIVTPHGRSEGYLQDPTHCNPCNQMTWYYFDPEHPLYKFYQPKPWRVEFLTWSPSANIEVVMRKRDE
jgi:predicted SAM-dependent methyltransferase